VTAAVLERAAPATLDRLRVGVHVTDDGSLAEYTLPVPGDGGRHLLVGGATGAGKSRFLRVLFAELAPRPNLALLLQDPKRVEFGPMAPRATTVAKHRDSAVEFLERLCQLMDDRYERMEHQGVSQLEPSAEHPYVVAIFDEYAALGRGPSRDVNARHDKTEELIQMGRAAGIGLVLCTQKPDAGAVPTTIRDNLRVRIAFGCEGWQQSNMILGDGSGWNAERIPENRPGWAYSKVDRQVTHIRSYDMGDEQVRAIAAATAHLRVDLPDWPHVIDPRRN
jgi:DNA segregation ATPase FtsK/SpoIIIE-like protein